MQICLGQLFLMLVYMCLYAGYKEIVMQSLPQISVLDGLDRMGKPSYRGLVSPSDIPGLEDYVDLLLSSDNSHNEAVIFVVNTLLATNICHYSPII